MSFWGRFSLRCALVGLLGGLFGCQPEVSFDLPGQQACSPPEVLTSRFQQHPRIPGCLVILWEQSSGVPQASFPVWLQANGSMSAYGASGEPTAEVDISLPPEAKNTPLQFRLFLQQPDPLPSQAEHTKLCDAMKAQSFYCFAPAGKCWLSIQFQPKSDQKSHQVHPLPAGSCRFCQREVCDGADNNCNGKVDEFDEENNKSCSPTIP